MKTYSEVIAEVEASIEKPLISARFGDNWKAHTEHMIAEGQLTIDGLIELAWKQGRRGILLERVIEQSLSPNREEGRELQGSPPKELEEKFDTNKCPECGGRSALISGNFGYEPDEEPYSSGVHEESKVDSGDEWIHGFKCDNCGHVHGMWHE